MTENAMNKSASFHIYGDLIEVRNFAKVKANYVEIDFENEGIQKHIYFETKQKENDLIPSLILPINEYDYSNGSLNMLKIHQLFEEINKQQENSNFTSITLGIVSTDSTTVYYNLSLNHQI